MLVIAPILNHSSRVNWIVSHNYYFINYKSIMDTAIEDSNLAYIGSDEDKAAREVRMGA